MTKLQVHYTSQFERDVKRLTRRHVPLGRLFELIDLVIENTPDTQRTLADRFRLHKLHGEWQGSFECHVDGAGD